MWRVIRTVIIDPGGILRDVREVVRVVRARPPGVVTNDGEGLIMTAVNFVQRTVGRGTEASLVVRVFLPDDHSLCGGQRCGHSKGEEKGNREETTGGPVEFFHILLQVQGFRSSGLFV